MDNTETANIRLLQNVKEITDFDASELDVYARLTEAQLLNKDHPEKGLFIAESPKVIIRALDGGYEPVSVLVEKKQALEDAETIAVLERCANVPVYTAEFAVLTKLTGFKLTRGMLCVMKRRNLPGLREICAGCGRIREINEKRDSVKKRKPSVKESFILSQTVFFFWLQKPCSVVNALGWW